MQGTCLTIMGFRETDNWSQRIAASVIENYFYAIGTNQLTVIVEPDETSSDLMEISHDSIEDWFQYLMGTESLDDSQAASESPLKDAKSFGSYLEVSLLQRNKTVIWGIVNSGFILQMVCPARWHSCVARECW